jgi:glucokinase
MNLYIGVDLGGTDIKGGVVTSEGEIVFEKTISTEAREGVSHVMDRIAGLVRDLSNAVKEDGKVQSVGIGAPGQIDSRTHVMRNAPNLPGWHNVEVLPQMEERLNMKIVWDNDARLAALGEFSFGAGRGCSEMMMVTLGTGVGSGLIINGEIYRGSIGSAGEFGHTTIDPGGPQCGCGRRGCIEAYAGIKGVLRIARGILNTGKKSLLHEINWDLLSPKDISVAAEKGDKVAIKVFQEVGFYLGVGLANVATLLNLERFVIGGGVSRAGEFLLEPTRESLKKHAIETAWEAVKVMPAELGNQAGVIGAAKLAMKI